MVQLHKGASHSTGATHLIWHTGVMMSEQDTNPANQIMTIEQVARYLSLHELTVRRLAREGSIPAFKVGRQWRVKRELLDKWIERQAYENLGR